MGPTSRLQHDVISRSSILVIKQQGRLRDNITPQNTLHPSSCANPAGVVDLIGLPAVLAAEVFAIMRAVRVLLMYYPAKRKAWGRIPKEKAIFRFMAWAYALMEITMWLAAAVYGISR